MKILILFMKAKFSDLILASSLPKAPRSIIAKNMAPMEQKASTKNLYMLLGAEFGPVNLVMSISAFENIRPMKVPAPFSRRSFENGLFKKLESSDILNSLTLTTGVDARVACGNPFACTC
jgi:hypothetical protein